MPRAVCVAVVLGLALTLPLRTQQGQAPRWKAHDVARPKPRVITPGASVAQPPSDAVVLFDGSGLREWMSAAGGAPGWTVRDGYMETAPGAGAIKTRRGFGDAQIHLEWATPSRVQGNGQGRGNSGVIIMGLYEVQVLDSYGNQTYADGQAAAVYGQYPPLVNASRGPGEWQTYDIIFRRPRFLPNGSLKTPARMTVFHNGVLVQDHVELWGPTDWLQHRQYRAHGDALPLLLQDHANPVRYRNVWLRPLPDVEQPAGLATSVAQTTVPLSVLQSYAGTYATPNEEVARVTVRGGQLILTMPGSTRELQLVPVTRQRFSLLHTSGTVEFSQGDKGKPRIRLQFAEMDRQGDKR
ncbi:MAG TPA: family 16 glycoside hydrolase [Gemmatimonadaceae bacterium]|nr:family 16 glycoside hydrolase [Gemmatimonadaceae bacterium]